MPHQRKIKVLSVFGTRPEAIKMAPVVKELEDHSDLFISKVCVTAQHRTMLDQVLSLFNIMPDYDLKVMQEKQSLSRVAAKILTELEPVLLAEKPDWVLVQGDTTTAAAAALAGFYAGIKIGHVEAGLRTFNKLQPFPEEINRRIAGVIADLHFAPTQRARQNLCKEGVPEEAILVTGNSVIDAINIVAGLPYEVSKGPLHEVKWDKRIIVVTAHRRENFGAPLENICQALIEIAQSCARHVHIVYPVHLNPNVREPVYRLLGNIPTITLTDPLDYIAMVHLMKHAILILTDSGGIQEEAPGLGKPVLVLRDVTERPEAVEAGTVRLVGTQRQRIIDETMRLLTDEDYYAIMAKAVNPYGDGHASERIVQALSRG